VVLFYLFVVYLMTVDSSGYIKLNDKMVSE
jgi:hypothetical protein